MKKRERISLVEINKGVHDYLVEKVTEYITETNKTSPECKYCGGTGKVLVEASEDGMKYMPCGCTLTNRTTKKIPQEQK